MLDYNDKNLDLDEIVFENRNHAYGAYELRRRYERRVRAAMAWASSGLVALALIPVIGMRMHPTAPVPVSDTTLIVFEPVRNHPAPELPPQPPMPEPAAAPRVPVDAVVFNEPVIDPNATVSDVPDQDSLRDHAIVSDKPETNLGEPGEGLDILPGNGSGSGGGPGNGQPGDLGLGESNEPLNVVEQMPEAGYDIEGFIAGKVRYPNEAVRNGVSGLVAVEFVVERDGSISNVTLLKGIGSGCDEEALRVVKQMPAWQPGKQNGRTVRVRSRVPIRFRLKD